MLMCMGGPIIPARTAGHREVAGELRDPRAAPGRRPHAGFGQPVWSQAETRLPRCAPWPGDRRDTCRSTKRTPTTASGAAGVPRCTAPTSAPMATASPAASRPGRRRTAHQATANLRSALGKTAKNFHSAGSRSPRHGEGSLRHASLFGPVGSTMGSTPPPRRGPAPARSRSYWPMVSGATAHRAVTIAPRERRNVQGVRIFSRRD